MRCHCGQVELLPPHRNTGSPVRMRDITLVGLKWERHGLTKCEGNYLRLEAGI